MGSDKVSVTVRIPEAEIAWLEKVKAARGVSISHIVREAIRVLMKASPNPGTVLEQEVAGRASKRLTIDMERDRPKMFHEGVRFVQVIWETIQEEKEALALFKSLDATDYGYFRKLITANRGAALHHEDPQAVNHWLDIMDAILAAESQNPPPRKELLKRYWAKRGVEYDDNVFKPMRKKRGVQPSDLFFGNASLAVPPEEA